MSIDSRGGGGREGEWVGRWDRAREEEREREREQRERAGGMGGGRGGDLVARSDNRRELTPVAGDDFDLNLPVSPAPLQPKRH